MLQAERAALAPMLAQHGFEQVPGTGVARWRGRFADRDVEVFLLPVGRTRYIGEVRLRQQIGCRIEVTVSTSLAVKAVLVAEEVTRRSGLRWLWRLRSMHGLPNVPPQLAGLRLVAHDAEWGARLLHDHASVAALSALQQVAPTPTSGSVYAVPGRVSQISPILSGAEDLATRVEASLVGLSAFASAAEALAPPSRPAVSGPIARAISAHPVLAVLLFFAAALVLLALGGALMLGLFLTLMTLR